MCARKLEAHQLISSQRLKYTSEANSMKMKLILVLVIVFSLDILTMVAERKLPQHEEKDSPAMNFDVSNINDAALTKRAIGKHCSGKIFAQHCTLRAQRGIS